MRHCQGDWQGICDREWRRISDRGHMGSLWSSLLAVRCVKTRWKSSGNGDRRRKPPPHRLAFEVVAGGQEHEDKGTPSGKGDREGQYLRDRGHAGSLFTSLPAARSVRTRRKPSGNGDCEDQNLRDRGHLGSLSSSLLTTRNVRIRRKPPGNCNCEGQNLRDRGHTVSLSPFGLCQRLRARG